MSKLTSRAKSAAIVFLGSTATIVAGYVFWDFTDPRPAPSNLPGGAIIGPRSSVPFISQAIDNPPAIPADQVKMADADEVIGVSAGGKARAYRVKAFFGQINLVVNDVVGGTPVSVTHCDRKKLWRVFTDEGSQQLEIMLGGYIDGLVLYIRSDLYFQATGLPTHENDPAPFPFRPYPFEKTTWKAWLSAHPQTDAYVEPPKTRPDPVPPRRRK